MSPDESCYYHRGAPAQVVDGRYRASFVPTRHTGGAWQDAEQHMGPVSGLVVHAVEESLALRPASDELRIARVGFDILGVIADGPTEVAVEVRRRGRTIELLEATVITGGRPCVTARLWRLLPSDSGAVAGGAPDPLPAPGAWPLTDAFAAWRGGFIASVEARVEPGQRTPIPGTQASGAPGTRAEGWRSDEEGHALRPSEERRHPPPEARAASERSEDRPVGRTRAWLRAGPELVAGEPSSDLARFVGLVDAANGIAIRESPRAWMFPNVDLTVHLFRQPTGRWVGFDTTVIFGADGVGVTSTTLHDTTGPVGRAEQILTVRRLS